MARDRQRAKRRKEKRQPSPPSRQDGEGVVPDPRPIHRENVPGPLEHASGEVDEFEAALVDGADGEPVQDEERVAGTADDEPVAEPAEDDPVAAADERDLEEPGADEPDFDEFEAEDEDDEPAAAGRTPATTRASAPAERRGAGRFIAFLRASWAELQRVQWPDRRQVAQATAVVLGFVVVAGVYLGVADRIAQEVVDLII